MDEQGVARDSLRVSRGTKTEKEPEMLRTKTY